MAQLPPAPIPYLDETGEVVSPPNKEYLISPATSQPYNWICHLKITMKSRAVYGGSGFLVNLPDSDVKCILTAGHCLWDKDGYAEVVEVKFPGRQAFWASGSEFRVSAKWKQNLTELDGFGAICLKDVTKSQGGFGYSTIVTNQQLLTTDATMFGYPVDKSYQTMWGSGGSVCEVTPLQFMYNFCAGRGQSGSPVYIWHNGYWTAVGIHLHECQTDNELINFAIRLNIDNMREILSLIEYPMFQRMLQATDSDQKLVKIAKGATAWTGSGSGLVIARYKKDEYTVLDFIPLESPPGNSPLSGQVKYAIASNAFPKTYLRLDGSGLFSKKKVTSRGEGTVNCQPTALAYEFFNIIPDSTVCGKVNIQSAEFPGVFLRIDASCVSEDHEDGDLGSVNAQWTADNCERFELV